MLSFQRLDVYRCSIELLAFSATIDFPRGLSHLADQLRRAALSVPLNIAEAASAHQLRGCRKALRDRTRLRDGMRSHHGQPSRLGRPRRGPACPSDQADFARRRDVHQALSVRVGVHVAVAGVTRRKAVQPSE
jgi:hypothetical protein